MKTFFFSLALACLLTACNPSESSKKSDVGTEGDVAKSSASKLQGQWVSACINASSGKNYIEYLIFKVDGSGSMTRTDYPDQNCTGTAVRTEGPVPFSYTLTPRSDGFDASVLDVQKTSYSLTLNFKDADTLQVTNSGTTSTYRRIDLDLPSETVVAPPKSEAPVAADLAKDFELSVKGLWSTDCTVQEDGSSSILSLEFPGNSTVSQTVKDFENRKCTGKPSSDDPETTSYKLVSYSGGTGSISVSGQVLQISVKANKLSFGSMNLNRIK